MNAFRVEEKLTSILEIPKRFGEDGGNLFKYFDALADEIDEDMIKSLKSQLHGILIFAGTFAAVNYAFLPLIPPGMSPDLAEDTNDLPSASLSPSSGILPINILSSLSLTFALIASFLAVLGQQWPVYYRKYSGGGAEAQRWEQLWRYLVAKGGALRQSWTIFFLRFPSWGC
ncbi:hypothetical protein FRB90_007656 [Tulasnella sp. 427]|nr:hypothetical protein FRB90_007656 [Tulasnella sp. 427]